MTKRATKTKNLRLARPAVRTVTSSEAPTATSVTSSFADAVLSEASQALSSDEEALDFLVSSITDKLSGAGQGRSQMHEFLSLILETDPALKEEILQEIILRK
jgi:hypothetical protein